MPTATKPAPTTTKDGHRPEEVPEQADIADFVARIRALMRQRMRQTDAVRKVCDSLPRISLPPFSAESWYRIIVDGVNEAVKRDLWQDNHAHDGQPEEAFRPVPRGAGGGEINPSRSGSYLNRVLGATEYRGADGFHHSLLDFTDDDFEFLDHFLAAMEAGIERKRTWIAQARACLKKHKAKQVRDLPGSVQWELAQAKEKAWV